MRCPLQIAGMVLRYSSLSSFKIFLNNLIRYLLIKFLSTAPVVVKPKSSTMIFRKIGDECEGIDRTHLFTWEMKKIRESLEWSLVIYSTTGSGAFPGMGCVIVIA